MAFNRNTAKAQATQRQTDRRILTNQVLDRWTPEVPPYTPRCRKCGGRPSSHASHCPMCGTAL